MMCCLVVSVICLDRTRLGIDTVNVCARVCVFPDSCVFFVKRKSWLFQCVTDCVEYLVLVMHCLLLMVCCSIVFGICLDRKRLIVTVNVCVCVFSRLVAFFIFFILLFF